ncbi:hypothetical protein FQA47_008752 [Oryzias melastigma]|uniref:Uncharacterized protein n=1 Tax=Oryzias melastigma TaxID=30732 RepID=A0A834CNK9_ORYME|nr:hypothetical protein FQA47_008752 [Oryzias melastigma]
MRFWQLYFIEVVSHLYSYKDIDFSAAFTRGSQSLTGSPVDRSTPPVFRLPNLCCLQGTSGHSRGFGKDSEGKKEKKKGGGMTEERGVENSPQPPPPTPLLLLLLVP